ncbi:hypothetical protein QA640_25105 [Bradyrhizobium sp. CB82]|uniref:hypothetical protein n=1 Tax=Bradyrhizobium sp. CB82 TaxID=3039159 RepID=UPI0024B1C191|nr:hypothetical protein [Bradyrhizobium sp. CB82]WFU37742.1 hypothetical protein QA640_25105 [Bradyrhizobium sp. CB82]
METGDIILGCTVYSPIFPAEPDEPVSEVESFTFDLIVMSQTCDLVIGREKLENVVLCPIAQKSEIERDASHALRQRGALVQAAKNKEPAFFILQASDHPECLREVSAVHFREVHTLPVSFLRRVAAMKGPRLRLCSPYKEALATRFAAFFGRVGLPEDIQI